VCARLQPQFASQMRRHRHQCGAGIEQKSYRLAIDGAIPWPSRRCGLRDGSFSCIKFIPLIAVG
jgi:hypothetical protein